MAPHILQPIIRPYSITHNDVMQRMPDTATPQLSHRRILPDNHRFRRLFANRPIIMAATEMYINNYFPIATR